MQGGKWSSAVGARTKIAADVLSGGWDRKVN